MKSKEYRNTQLLANLVCGILALLALLPFILLIVASLTDNTWATANGFSFFPGSWSLDAYRYIAVQWATIGRAYLMTIVVTIIGTAASIMVTTLFAYAICQQEVPGMKLLSFMMVFTMLFNGGLVATYYSYVNYFHVRNTIWALIVPNLLMNAFNVILVRNYFTNSIPASLIEAARLDGASEYRIYRSIIKPNLSSAIAAALILIFIDNWNIVDQAVIFLREPYQQPLSVYLCQILEEQPDIFYAASVFYAVPVLLIFLMGQDYLIQGISMSGVKA